MESLGTLAFARKPDVFPDLMAAAINHQSLKQ
jgi:hypothetical protein